MGRMIVKFVFVFLLIQIISGGLLLSAQPHPGIPDPPGLAGPDMDTIRAREEFRIGVQAYNRFSFNEAILSFERALAFRPGEPLVLDWLGRAYFRSGIEGAAFLAWQAAAEGFGLTSSEGILITSRLQTLRNRRILLPVPDDDVRYVESGRYPGMNAGVVLYRQPTAVLPQNDGSVWVVAFGSNEIVRIDVNGIIRDRRRGPMFIGFDRPYDIVRSLDGNLFLSEFRGNRVSVLSPDGDFLFHIGSRGHGPGQFVGPQNMTVDEEGFLYVVDFGNRRVSKFDPLGEFILSFGPNTFGFQGFLAPTGIASRDGRIFVADSARRQIFTFDTNGSFLGVLVGSGLYSPEGLHVLSDGRLLAVDANRILLIDPDTAIVRELGLLGNRQQTRITSAAVDRNGNVLVADFNSGEVAIMTRVDDMAAGLFVQVRRIVSDNFPNVIVEVEVTDRLRRPIVGLDGLNFLLSEGGIPVLNQSLLSASYRSNDIAISVLFERSSAMRPFRNDLPVALRDAAQAAEGNVVSVVSAGVLPSRENITPAPGVAAAVQIETVAQGALASFSPAWRFDLGLRLAATDLLAADHKRAVVFVGSGSLGEFAFEQYTLSELAAYLSNNNVVFYAVIVGGGMPGADILYLTERTGGSAMALFRPEGIIPEIRALAQAPSGIYTLGFTSRLPTDFGRAYMPLEVEVYLMERSGRDNTGYFSPLQ
ncbi:MAG: NHL repeat-containing protein [Treponema sp.]|nr:NHL repeat-containing protein [Treponema sp.]